MVRLSNLEDDAGRRIIEVEIRRKCDATRVRKNAKERSDSHKQVRGHEEQCAVEAYIVRDRPSDTSESS